MFTQYPSLEAEYRAARSNIVKELVNYQKDKRRFKPAAYKRVNPKLYASKLLSRQGLKDAKRICRECIQDPETKQRDRVFFKNVLAYLK